MELESILGAELEAVDGSKQRIGDLVASGTVVMVWLRHFG